MFTITVVATTCLTLMWWSLLLRNSNNIMVYLWSIRKHQSSTRLMLCEISERIDDRAGGTNGWDEKKISIQTAEESKKPSTSMVNKQT